MWRAGVRTAGVVSLSLAAWAAASSDPVGRARAILRSGGYQTDLPHAPAPERESILNRPATAPGVALPPPIQIPVPLEALAVIGLGAAIASGVWLLLRRLDPSLPSLGVTHPEGSVTTVLTRDRSGDDAEALAREGRFADAIHALLLDALRVVGRQGESRPAWTSREVLRGAGLAAEPRAALAPLVGAVEAVHFGRAAAGLEDYLTCAAIYRRFQEACRPTR